MQVILSYSKISGVDNLADLLTKHLSREIVDRHLDAMSLVRTVGRAASAPRVSAAICELRGVLD